MKTTRFIAGIICLIIDLIVCAAVCHQWAQVECSAWSLAAAVFFYTVGCVGLYICIMEVASIIDRSIHGGKYPKNPTIR